MRHWENRHLACSFSAQAGCLCSQYQFTSVFSSLHPSVTDLTESDLAVLSFFLECRQRFGLADCVLYARQSIIFECIGGWIEQAIVRVGG